MGMWRLFGSTKQAVILSLSLGGYLVSAQQPAAPAAVQRGVLDQPVFVRAEVEEKLGGYEYRYILENRNPKPVLLSAFGLIVPKGTRVEPLPAGDFLFLPPGMERFWSGVVPRDSLIRPLWKHPLPGGGSVGAAKLWSQDPPGLRKAFLDPWGERDFDSRLYYSLTRRCVPSMEEVAKWRKDTRWEVSILAPVAVERGTYAHWDQVLSDLAEMGRVHWLSEDLAKLLRNCVSRARMAAAAQNPEGVRRALAEARRALSPTGGNAHRNEVEEYFAIHQDLFLHETFPTSAPRIRIAPEEVHAVLGQSAALSAAVVDEAGQRALSNRRILLEVTLGPDAGLRKEAVTGVDGKVVFQVEGVALGRDEVRMSLLAEGVQRTVETSCGATIDWSQTPDLAVFSFFPPMLLTGPGHLFYVNECTMNRGAATAGASVTRYFAIPFPGAPRDQRIPVGQRYVPPLAPGEMSCVVNGELTFPSAVLEGRLYLEAEVDILNEVLESDEANTARSNQGLGGGNFLAPAIGAPVASGVEPLQQEASAQPWPAGSAALVPEDAIPWVDRKFLGRSRKAFPTEKTEPPPPTPSETCYGEKDWATLVEGRSAGGEETYYFSRKNLPQGLLREAIGEVTVLWYWLRRLDPKSHVDWKDFRTWEPISVPFYGLGSSGFKEAGRLSLADLKPFGADRWNEGCYLTFFATSRDGDFVETVVDTSAGRRVWLRLAEMAGDDLDISYSCLSGECSGETSGHPDWAVFNPHPVLKLYLAPDPKAPWLPFEGDQPILAKAGESADGLYMADQVNGFARIVVFEQGSSGSPPLTVGWLPIRDADGTLLLWPVSYGC